jgi:hypothetical protein
MQDTATDPKTATVHSEDGTGVAALVKTRTYRPPSMTGDEMAAAEQRIDLGGSAFVVIENAFGELDLGSHEFVHGMTLLVADPHEVRSIDVGGAVHDALGCTEDGDDSPATEVVEFHAVHIA